MQLTCPCCFARFAIEAALTDDAARQAVAAALKMPAPLGDLTLRYLALFRPAKRALSWDRAARLLNELLEPIQAGRVERHGRSWAAPLDAWRDAFEQMLARRDKLTLPLASHGYLFEIVAGGASKVEGRAEAEAEKKKRNTQRAAQGTPTAVAEHLASLKELVKP